MSRSCRIWIALWLCLIGFSFTPLFAQVRPNRLGPKAVEVESPAAGGAKRAGGSKSAKNTPATIILMELTTGDEGVGFRAQRWHQVFESLDVLLTIRGGTSRDKHGITEKKLSNGARQVHILGKLDQKGRVIVEDRVFAEGDVAKLTRWIDELREYGAQGTPDGQPAWGLTKDQFAAVHEALRQPLRSDPKGEEIAVALKLLQLPADLPVRLSESAAKRLKERDETKVGQSLGTIAQGTALAAMTAEHGLGFRPQRLRDGAIVLSIEPIGELREPWPVGWPLSQPTPTVAPRLFSFTNIDLQEIELDAVLDAAADFIDMPILVDRAGLTAKKIDLAQIKVSHPAKRTTWGLALRRLLAQSKAKFEVLADESGRPFLWVTPNAVPRRSDG